MTNHQPPNCFRSYSRETTAQYDTTFSAQNQQEGPRYWPARNFEPDLSFRSPGGSATRILYREEDSAIQATMAEERLTDLMYQI